MFAVTPAAATTGRQWLKSSGLITVVRAAFHLCPLMRIREAFRYLWPYCTRNRKGNFKVGMRTEKSRLRRSLASLQELMQRIRHHPISEQADEQNVVLRGHYAYYGVAGNLRSLVKVYRVVERSWRRMLCSRSWAGRRLTWDAFNQIKERTPLLTPKLRLPYGSGPRT
jgi:hypothetical protein